SAVATDYAEWRPDFPVEVTEALVAATPQDGTIVELGAGTGKLTCALAERRRRLIAVEPVAEMRAELSRRVPEACVVAATAEHTGLRDGVAHVVVAAQAFHWFDADASLTEMRRISGPRAQLALLWNNIAVQPDQVHLWHEVV